MARRKKSAKIESAEQSNQIESERRLVIVLERFDDSTRRRTRSRG